MAKGKGGFLGQDGLNAPDQATGVSATAGDTEATVSFTAPSDVGGSAITGYRVQSNDGIGASGSSSPITVTGLTNGTSYTFNVWAINALGWSAPSDASGNVTPSAPTGLVAGFYVNGASVDSINLATAGTATDFGDLTQGRYFTCGAGSNTRFIVVAGDVSFSTVTTIDYTAYGSTGTFTDFGDTNVRQSQGNNSPVSNITRSCFMLSAQDGGTTAYNNISYITNATTGNATDFGDSSASRFVSAGLSSTTRGVFGGGYTGSSTSNVIDYIAIASTGNATDFGNLTLARNQLGGCASATRGLFCGGGGYNTIDYITIASTGNATDFGDLPSGNYTNVAMATSTIAVITEGSSGANLSTVTIASTGNATDWGYDLTRTRSRACGGSSAAASVQQGGLQ